MQKFKEYLKHRDPEVYNEILGTLALGTAAAGLIAPKQTGRALKYIGKKGVDMASNVGGHLLNTGINLGADALRAGGSGAAYLAGKGAELAGKGIAGTAKLAGKGVVGAAKLAGRGIKGAFQKSQNASRDQTNTPVDQNGGTWYA